MIAVGTVCCLLWCHHDCAPLTLADALIGIAERADDDLTLNAFETSYRGCPETFTGIVHEVSDNASRPYVSIRPDDPATFARIGAKNANVKPLATFYFDSPDKFSGLNLSPEMSLLKSFNKYDDKRQRVTITGAIRQMNVRGLVLDGARSVSTVNPPIDWVRDIQGDPAATYDNVLTWLRKTMGSSTSFDAKITDAFERKYVYPVPWRVRWTGRLYKPLRNSEDCYILTPPTFSLARARVESKRELQPEGKSLVVAALVGQRLHLRIFDADGVQVVDKGEADLLDRADGVDRKGWLAQVRAAIAADHLSERDADRVASLAMAIADYNPIGPYTAKKIAPHAKFYVHENNKESFDVKFAELRDGNVVEVEGTLVGISNPGFILAHSKFVGPARRGTPTAGAATTAAP
jgi:hypothetical protein